MEDEKKLYSTEEAENDIETETVEFTDLADLAELADLADFTDEEPQQTSLDSLLFDADDSLPSHDDDTTNFEAFMAEYRSLISKTLSDAAEAREAKEQENEAKTESAERIEYEKEYLIATPKKNKKKQSLQSTLPDEPLNTTKGEWNDAITLDPEEYEDLTQDDEMIEEEIEIIPDFDLGQEHSDGIQLSISFDGSESSAPEVVEDIASKEEYNPEKPRIIDWVFDVVEMFVYVLAAVILLTSFVFKHSVVEGSSMNNTLQDGDHLIISDLFYTPERGDVVVFEDYSTVLKKAVVKRVIGLPGETVEVKLDSEGNVTVYINGTLLEEDYAYNAKDVELYANYSPVTLGEDEIFVMGDNRYHSTDSRNSGVGPVKVDSILGKVLFRFLPFDSFGIIE